MPSRRLTVLRSFSHLIVAYGCWVTPSFSSAKSNFEGTRNYAQQAEDAPMQGDTKAGFRAAEAHARDARDATHSVPWNIAALVRWLGSAFKSGQQIDELVQGLASDVGTPGERAGTTTSPGGPDAGGRVDVGLLQTQESQFSEIPQTGRLDAEAQATSDPRNLLVPREAPRSLGAMRVPVQPLIDSVTSKVSNAELFRLNRVPHWDVSAQRHTVEATGAAVRPHATFRLTTPRIVTPVSGAPRGIVITVKGRR